MFDRIRRKWRREKKIEGKEEVTSKGQNKKRS